MMAESSIEERLNGAFGVDMTTAQRAFVDARVGEAMTTSEARGWRRWHVRRSVLLVGALLALAPVVFTVGAAILSTEAPYGMGNAAAYEAELAAAKEVTPIPPGATWPPYLEVAPDRSASYGTGLGTSMVETNAFCLWLGYWYEANQRGDAVAAVTATDVLEQARTWRTLTDPLTTDANGRALHQRTIDAVVGGDAATVLRELDINCSGTWAPVK